MTLPLPPLVTYGVPLRRSVWLRHGLNKGGERSWRVDVVRLVVTRRTDDKWGDASRGTSPTDTQGLSVELCQNKKTDKLPSGRWQDKQTPIAFVLKLLLLGTPLARTVDTLLTDACGGCIIACKSTYRGMHIENVLIIHHFFERDFA